MMQVSKFYVNGEWRSSPSARPVVNPYTATTVAEVFQAGPADITDAIAAAESSFAETRRLTSYERSEILSSIARGIDERKEQLAQILSGEIGKPITAARLEVERAVFTFATSSEEAKRIGGEIIPLDLTAASENRMGLVRRFPLGPVAAITPFNFPLNLVAHKVGPAIAAGNTVVLKPSSSAPMISLALAEIVDNSGLPRGAFNVVPCLSKEGEQLFTDQRIKLVSFTGSPGVGWYIKEKAGKKRVVLELGGNAGVIVDSDAALSYAYPRIVWGSYGIAGQSCIAVQRIFVHESVYETFLHRFVELSLAVPTGDPSDEKTVVGPMITESAARNVEEWIQEAVAGGARVLCGGVRRGAVLQPTVIVDAKPEMAICSNEVFAPVVTVEKFHDFREAVARVNNSRYGLQAGVFTGSIGHAMYAFENLEVGGVMVNDVSTYRLDHMPYGGVKDSGYGREGVRYAIEEMTEMKLLGLNVIG